MADCSDGTTTASDWVLFIHTTAKSWRNSRMAANFSGDTAPVVSGTYAVWYDTATNYIKYTNDNGTNWITSATSFPICIFTRTEGTASSIDRIFNGFGYIGKTAFVLPGVKGLIPEGRNEDGSSRNGEFTFSKVEISTFIYNKSTVIFTDWQGTLSERTTYYIVDTYSDMLAINKDGLYYVKNDNKCYSWAGGSGVVYANYTPIAFFDLDSTCNITSFNSKTTFRAVDYNDSSWLSGLGMSSGKYVDLTLGASASTYTAPANGYFFLGAVTSGSSNEIVFYDTSNSSGYAFSQTQSNYPIRCMQPIRKGVVLRIDYTGITTPPQWFRFIYAEGEK